MARPVYPYEMSDPDFVWLLETYRDNNPGYFLVQETCLPLVLIAEGSTACQEIAVSPEQFIPEDPFEKLLLPEPEGQE
ncbi:hypothetical protein MRY87_01045 [bacterium]|nr:hypothetical protein [bacterium]